MKTRILAQFKTYMLGMLCVGFGIFGVAESLADEEYIAYGSQKSLVKSGLYRSLGFYTGYHHYGEVGRDGSRVMRIDTATFGLMGELGLVNPLGIKLEGSARLGYGLGIYTGSILDTDNTQRNGQRVISMMGMSAGDVELRGGYNLLKASQMASLYLQGGLGYFFNRTEFMTMDRLQGYLYVPLELEGEVYIGNKGVLNYGLGYRYFIFGNHLSTASEYGFNDDYYVTQKNGFGLNAFIGRTYYGKDSTMRSIRLVYEYWHIGAADPMRTSSSITGKPTAIYEPENSTHRLLLQYSYGF